MVILKRALLCLVLALLLAVGVALPRGPEGTGAWDSAKANYEAAGQPWTLQELLVSFPRKSTESDAAADWLRVFELTKRPGYEGPSVETVITASDVLPPFSGTPWPNLAQAEAALSRNSEVMDAIVAALDKGGAARFEIGPGGHWWPEPNSLGADGADAIRTAAREHLQVAAAVAAHRGRSAECAARIRDLLRLWKLDEQLTALPMSSSAVAGFATVQIATRAVRHWMAWVRFSDDDLAMLRTELGSMHVRPRLALAFTGERVTWLGLALPRSWRLGTWLDWMNGKSAVLPIGSAESEVACAVAWFGALDAAARLSFPEAIEAVAAAVEARQVAAEDTGLLTRAAGWCGGSGLGAESLVHYAAEMHARIVMTDVALAVEQFRRKNARLPAKLAELAPAFLDNVPTDPFDGRQVRYRVTKKGFRVYSVGHGCPGSCRSYTDEGGVMRSEVEDDDMRASGPWDVVVAVEREPGLPAIKR